MSKLGVIPASVGKKDKLPDTRGTGREAECVKGSLRNPCSRKSTLLQKGLVGLEQFKMEGGFRPRKLFRELKVHCCDKRVVTCWGLGC